MMNLLIIQAHMGSTRLPGKVMKKICDKEVLLHVYERCNKCKLIDKIIIATSTDKDNDEIEKFCCINNIECFRGNENDVLDRYYQCAKLYNPNFIVRVTSDCPLLEPRLIDYWLENAINDNVDFVEEEKEIFTGFGVDIFSFNSLIKMKKKATTNKQKEHVVGYYYDNKNQFINKKYPLKDNLKYLYRDYRLTLDTKEDFELISLLYKKFYHNDFLDLQEVMCYLDKNNQILEINNMINQKLY
ncbi:putative polysaccharide biosynthesis cytidylyltransferase [Clostridium fallax]|uniref:Spore coat polysaccharide biosynthesis protein SpsF n=2 Tax=Clostridium fallax TaxID=1533 RepID=A0A1M4UKQ4_9CLOT|nr:spore coat polysaccharide biosynthesis protein SpsF [Clostridium fallax]SQB07617.1 putative polysaccharide biosynthesis cytidylyltransferase [Clostridium fallax]